MDRLKNWLYQFVCPRAVDEDQARKEFILNILLSGSIILILSTVLLNGIHRLVAVDQVSLERNALSFVFLITPLLFFLFLYFLSRRGFVRFASSLLLATFLALGGLMGYKWGIDLQAEILLFILVIVMTGILMSARIVFFLTGGIALFLFGLNYLQRTGVVNTSRYWRINMWGPVEVFVAILIFGVIAAVSWLSNREITMALARARRSESALKNERDLLEIKVEERTQALKLAQMEKISQLYRFAEFGRLSSGLFHDLTNHLSAVTLSVEQMQAQATGHEPAAVYLNQARKVSDRMKEFIAAIRKQIVGEQTVGTFCLNEEIKETIELLSYKARQHSVLFSFEAPEAVFITGDRTKWSQIVVNLLANAIDAYTNLIRTTDRRVHIALERDATNIILTVTDWATGIPDNLHLKIFEPFFTTKDFSRGTGLGLSLTKQIVEKDFGGSIFVESAEGSYTTFRIVLPLALYVKSPNIITSTSQTTAAG